MNRTNIRRIRTISEFHELRGLPKPEHPLISVIDLDSIGDSFVSEPMTLVFDFYMIALKRNCHAKFRYGQQEYDFDEGVMSFMSPNQVFGIEPRNEEGPRQTGWIMLIHPDFLWNTPLARAMKRYEFFDYSVNEALFLSEKEEATITGILKNIRDEYHNNIDKFSQDIIISQIEVLLNYSDRFYHRQFITRKVTNHKILERLEDILDGYFGGEDLMEKGLPSVQYVAGQLNVSPNYLSGLLKVLTGQSTQQHIHEKLIEKAKEKLSTTDLSVSEIAYALGFEHPQSLSKLFKSKTNLSPLEFRRAFN